MDSLGETVRVLFVIDSIWGAGGAETSLLRLIDNLPARYQCRVVTFHSDELADSFLARFPCPVEHWPMVSLRDPGSLRLAWRLHRLIRKQKIDLVHTFFPLSDLLAAPIAKLSGARVIISSRRDLGIVRKSWNGLAYRLLGPLYDEVQCVSEGVRRYTLETDHVDPRRTRVVYNGVAPAAAVCRPEYPDHPVVTLVASVRPVKGIDVFVRAAALVRARFPEARFVIAGSFGTNAEHVQYAKEVLELNQKLGNEGYLSFAGHSDNVAQVLSTSDVFVLPSRSEGFSNALLEAMAHGLPCVATEVGGNPEIIQDGITGHLAPPEDPAAIAGRVVALLSDPALRRRLGDAGREWVLRHFTIKRMSDEVARSYEELLHASVCRNAGTPFRPSTTALP